MDINEVQSVTAGINTLWCQSKLKKSGCASGKSDGGHDQLLSEMKYLLSKWISSAEPCAELEAIKALHLEPLNIVIPAYETLWRVVAHAVITATQVPEYATLLRTCYEEPASYSTRASGDPGFTTKAFMLEVLRLYPPTRRLSRVVEGGSWMTLKNTLSIWPGAQKEFSGPLALDIEALHRDPSIWGHDHLLFNPVRFEGGLSPQQAEAFMPFGYGKLKCIASEWAPKVAGIIAGGILMHVEDRSIAIESGTGDGANMKTAEEGGRKGWGDWRVRRA